MHHAVKLLRQKGIPGHRRTEGRGRHFVKDFTKSFIDIYPPLLNFSLSPCSWHIQGVRKILYDPFIIFFL